MNLDDLESAWAKTTPGPWELHPKLCGPDGQGVYNSDGGQIVEVGDPYPRGDNFPQENMEFIALAHEWWPKLIARIRELESERGS